MNILGMLHRMTGGGDVLKVIKQGVASQMDRTNNLANEVLSLYGAYPLLKRMEKLDFNVPGSFDVEGVMDLEVTHWEGSGYTSRIRHGEQNLFGREILFEGVSTVSGSAAVMSTFYAMWVRSKAQGFVIPKDFLVTAFKQLMPEEHKFYSALSPGELAATLAEPWHIFWKDLVTEALATNWGTVVIQNREDNL